MEISGYWDVWSGLWAKKGDLNTKKSEGKLLGESEFCITKERDCRSALWGAIFLFGGTTPGR